MSLMSRNIPSAQSFHPLFRLLDDFDNYSHQNRSGRNAALSFQPKFDVREVEDAYELHGELAGISKDNVHIEFIEPQTLHVHGRVERSYSSGTPPAGRITDAKSSGAITAPDSQQNADTSHKGEDHPKSPSPAPAGTASAEGQTADGAKYWISERSIGQFSRNFSFPSPIQQDAVTAGLKDGILTVRIPKAPKHEARRRVQIN